MPSQYYLPQKAAIALAIFVTSIIFGLAPRWMLSFASNHESLARQQDILTMATVFGGGVFLGAAFMHLLSEASETFIENQYEFPVTYLLCCIGFLTILGAEEFGIGGDDGHDHHHDHGDGDLEMRPLSASHSSKNSDDGDFNGDVDTDDYDDPQNRFGDDEALSQTKSHITRDSMSPMSGYALVGAMSFHSVFDGLAIGATNASSTQLTAVSVAVFAHKPIASFALGSMLIKGSQQQESQQRLDLERLMTRLIVFFALTSPVGIFLGVGTLAAFENSRSTWDTEIVSAVCQSFAAGTFLYVATVEVISKEFFSNQNEMTRTKKCLKFGMCCLGVLLMALLKLLEADEEED